MSKFSDPRHDRANGPALLVAAWARRLIPTLMPFAVGPLLGLLVLWLGDRGEPTYPDPSPRLWDCLGVEATAGLVAGAGLALAAACIGIADPPAKPRNDDLADF